MNGNRELNTISEKYRFERDLVLKRYPYVCARQNLCDDFGKSALKSILHEMPIQEI